LIASQALRRVCRGTVLLKDEELAWDNDMAGRNCYHVTINALR